MRNRHKVRKLSRDAWRKLYDTNIVPQHPSGPRWLRRQHKMFNRKAVFLSGVGADNKPVTINASNRAPQRVSGGRTR